MIWQMEVTNPQLYVKEFAEFSQNFAKKYDLQNSYGVGYPISGKNADFSHFVWVGAPDVETALKNTKEMYSDPSFAKYSAKVNDIRKVVNTMMMVRVMDF